MSLKTVRLWAIVDEKRNIVRDCNDFIIVDSKGMIDNTWNEDFSHRSNFTRVPAVCVYTKPVLKDTKEDSYTC